ncbi:chaperonin 10-like protein [Triangularia verruculosa]|uniref:Chaperonin 10-like protein n=1 Tax=Triangularia verruculosa TaxID=2587418 RepID=A0AAN6X7Z4_9PEZI|nr:chaperonin 10-like protein [Triangularia verruculosa]
MSSPIPTTRSAIIQGPAGKPSLAHNLPIPPLTPGTVLIKVTAVALNPSDYKMPTFFPTPGSIIGYDFSGTILSIHPDTPTPFLPGDLVSGGVRGSSPLSPTTGAFTTYLVTTPTLLLRLPRNLPPPSAATLPTALATSTLSLFDPTLLSLPYSPISPSPSPTPVLVYGGSTATGTIAIQLLKLSGFSPIATCSPSNFPLVREAGADAVFDYTLPDVATKIKSYTNNRLKHALDCISDSQSVAICYDSLSRTGGRYVSLEYVPDELLSRRKAVKAGFMLAFQIAGEASGLPGGYDKPADPGKLELGVRFWGVYQKLLDEGKLKPHPVQRLEGGLEGVIKGLELLRSGGVSGKKLVAVLDE